MTPRKFYRDAAKEIIKELRTRRGVSYKKLAATLNKQGWVMTDQVLINRINRGTFSFAFALQLLAILGEDKLPVPRAARPEKTSRNE
jgi:hypothetical protein